MEISVGLTARFGAVMILKALTVVLFFLLMLPDLPVHFRLYTLNFLMNAVALASLFVDYRMLSLLLRIETPIAKLLEVKKDFVPEIVVEIRVVFRHSCLIVGLLCHSCLTVAFNLCSPNVFFKNVLKKIFRF